MMIAYRYDGTFAGFLTCVWDAMEGNIEPAAFLLSGGGATLWETREPAPDQGRARRLYSALARRVSPEFQKMIARGFLTCLPEKELDLLALIRRGLREGDRVRLDLSDPVIARVNLALTKMWTEWDHLKGFVRFSDLDGFLVGEIEPKNRVLPLLRPHFCDRMYNETFLLYDRAHREALVHRPGQWAIVPMESFRMAAPSAEEAQYRRLWKRFYDTIEIKERRNPRLRMSNMPKRYWETMTEFQDEDHFLAGADPLPERRPDGLPGAP